MLDLKRRGKLKWLGLCGTSAEKVNKAQAWLHEGIGKTYTGLNTELDALYPRANTDRYAYRKAIAELPGEGQSAVTIFTPDETHFDIALCAIQHAVHVMLAKPAVHTLEQHQTLVEAAKKTGVLVCVEFHKRFDPIYMDAVQQMRNENIVGDFGYFYAYMSQPKYQLKTFQSWAGRTSDISYYLNSHHIDLLTWALQGKAKPIQVSACASTGVANGPDYQCAPEAEDTITLLVKFQVKQSYATAVFTSSWTAPNKGECHSQQRFHFLGSKAEIRVDQAHRGYEMTTDTQGLASRNPLFMKYTPNANGSFDGKQCYGYRSFEKWVQSCRQFDDETVPEGVATLESTAVVTAILEAGRKSLHAGGIAVEIK